MPVAKDVLVHAQGKEYGLLRGKAMESVALIGQAVGKEQFLLDAREILEILIRVQGNDGSSGQEVGPETQYVSQALVRIGSVLREDFVPYLPVVIPRLLKQASIEPDVVLLDVNEEVPSLV